MRLLCVLLGSLAVAISGCADRKSVPTGARNVEHVDQSKTESLEWPTNDWPERIEGENTKPFTPAAHGVRDGRCLLPTRRLYSDAADWPARQRRMQLWNCSPSRLYERLRLLYAAV